MCIRKGVYTRTRHRHTCTHARTRGVPTRPPPLSDAQLCDGLSLLGGAYGAFRDKRLPLCVCVYVNKPGSPWKGRVRLKLAGPCLREGPLSLSISLRAWPADAAESAAAPPASSLCSERD